MIKISLFIFRRDLRIEDNKGLIEAFKSSKLVIPCFILNPKQIEKNPYQGQASLNFMYESLEDLNQDFKKKGGRLYLFKGPPHEIIQKIHKSIKIDAVFINREYTPFGEKRDAEIKEVCGKKNIMVNIIDDYLLNPPEEVLKKDYTAYKKFTPFFRAAKKLPVAIPNFEKFTNFFKTPIEGNLSIKEVEKILNFSPNPLSLKGGRKNALNILKHLKRFKNYAKDRDYPILEMTSHLSPHHKFGTISVREAFFAVRANLDLNHPLINQLYWRDFFTYIGFHFPQVLGKCFYPKYEKLEWENDQDLFKAWKKGLTGFPIVDAGMRQLNLTGFMHNRVRMIVASFLCKDLLIDWRMGEKYFAQNLSDYDPLVNNGNWQWAAGTGCDSVPYFRIFNPWLQQKKFDKDCEYIKRWVPELKNLDPKIIHNLNINFPKGLDYPKPILDHQKRKELILKIYRKASKSGS